MVNNFVSATSSCLHLVTWWSLHLQVILWQVNVVDWVSPWSAVYRGTCSGKIQWFVDLSLRAKRAVAQVSVLALLRVEYSHVLCKLVFLHLLYELRAAVRDFFELTLFESTIYQWAHTCTLGWARALFLEAFKQVKLLLWPLLYEGCRGLYLLALLL